MKIGFQLRHREKLAIADNQMKKRILYMREASERQAVEDYSK